MITDELRALLDPMDEADLYEVSYYLIRLRREMRKRQERRREEAREEESKEKEQNTNTARARTRGEFVKPTVEEVAAFCKEKGYNIDPTLFVSYYETKGWIVGKTRMKDWHSAVRTWVRLDAQRAAERAADRKAREKRFNRGSGWTPPPICDEYKEAQLAELRKAGF